MILIFGVYGFQLKALHPPRCRGGRLEEQSDEDLREREGAAR